MGKLWILLHRAWQPMVVSSLTEEKRDCAVVESGEDWLWTGKCRDGEESIPGGLWEPLQRTHQTGWQPQRSDKSTIPGGGVTFSQLFKLLNISDSPTWIAFIKGFSLFCLHAMAFHMWFLVQPFCIFFLHFPLCPSTFVCVPILYWGNWHIFRFSHFKDFSHFPPPTNFTESVASNSP